jgi:2-keto-4-pentenoate hydratase/2-oxohepta-3-ene-1,7-dioic acid hydratase in catechol pathway
LKIILYKCVYTPFNIGVGYTAVPVRTLLPGDEVKIEIEGIGILENKVAD